LSSGGYGVAKWDSHNLISCVSWETDSDLINKSYISKHYEGKFSSKNEPEYIADEIIKDTLDIFNNDMISKIINNFIVKKKLYKIRYNELEDILGILNCNKQKNILQ